MPNPKDNLKNLLKITLTLLTAIVMSVGILKPEILNGTPASPAVGNWYQQFMPDLNGKPVSDIMFVDSLTGYGVTGDGVSGDTNFIIKTTNSGNNWSIVSTTGGDFSRVFFLNPDTGYVSGILNSFGAYLIKTTNAGANWTLVNVPSGIFIRDIHILNNDTMWLVHESVMKSIYRTTNGSVSWEQQFLDPNPLTKVYMYNGRLGFFSTDFKTYRTTNSGLNWNEINGEKGFRDIYFADSLTGWKADTYIGINDTNIRKTTNGGLNWYRQKLPTGGFISSSYALNIAGINKDTLFAVGGYVQFPNGQYRGIIYRTINGGNNWFYQIPDTTINIPIYSFVDFTSKSNGWAFLSLPVMSIHTTNGGDPIWITTIEAINNEVPKQFRLEQNYPNPFNPKTNIKYSILSNVKGEMSNVSLIVYDITGREIAILVNTEQNPGTYLTEWNASGYSCGVYFYKLSVTAGKEVFTETKRMMLIK